MFLYLINYLILSLLNSIFIVLEDIHLSMGASNPWQLSFQDPATPIMEGIIFFHNDVMVFVVAICIFVLWMLLRSVDLFSHTSADLNTEIEKNNSGSSETLSVASFGQLYTNRLYSKGVIHNTFLEIVWTIVPALILLVIAIPSFALLYSIEEFIEPSLTVKCTGHQWYWCYEYSNCKKEEIADYIDGHKFESYMVPTEDLGDVGKLRLLEVDKRLALPTNTHIQISVTGADVLHCWAVPSLGVKIDACPGRINQTTIFLKRSGTFFGQCSELCGVNHGFMPIVVRALSMYDFMFLEYVDHILNTVEDN
jgi:cytochrome c oxidase subunit 2